MENKTGTFTAKKNIDFHNMFQGNNKIKVQQCNFFKIFKKINLDYYLNIYYFI